MVGKERGYWFCENLPPISTEHLTDTANGHIAWPPRPDSSQDFRGCGRKERQRGGAVQAPSMSAMVCVCIADSVARLFCHSCCRTG